jgi:hypothetical protein
MKRTGRLVAAPTKNESQKLLWLGVTIAAPSAGMCPAPVIESRNQTRMKAATRARTTAYRGLTGPRSRARRWASSLVTGGL